MVRSGSIRPRAFRSRKNSRALAVSSFDLDLEKFFDRVVPCVEIERYVAQRLTETAKA